MKELFKAIGREVWDRVVISNKSTIVGWLLGAGVIAVDQIAQAVAGWHSPYAPVLAMLVGLAGSALKNKAKVAEVRVQPVPEQPKGYATSLLVSCLAFGLTLAALFIGYARADDPKFGGCLKNGTTCFAPAVSVNVIAMSIKDGSLVSTFDPGIGYGATFASDQWYRTGVSLTASFPVYEGGRRVMPAVMLSFAEYVRFGVACPYCTASA